MHKKLRLRIPDLVFFSLVVVVCVLYTLCPTNPDAFFVSIYVLTWIIGGLVTPFSILYLLKRWRLHERMKQITIISLAIGFYLLLQAEIVYVLYPPVLNIGLPDPSWGDVFWIAGQLLLLVAFYSMLKWAKYFQKPKLQILTILASVGLGIVVLGTLIIPVMIDIKEAMLATAVAITYSLIDVLLFSATFACSITLFQSFHWKRWVPIPLGFLLFSIGDMGFSILLRSGTYSFGHPIEALYLFGKLAVGYGCFQVASQTIDLRAILQHA